MLSFFNQNNKWCWSHAVVALYILLLLSNRSTTGQSLKDDLVTEFVSDQLLALDDEELAQVVNTSDTLRDGNFGVFLNTPNKSKSEFYKREIPVSDPLLLIICFS